MKAQQNPTDVIASLIFEPCHSREYVQDSSTGATEMVEKSYISFYRFDHDDHLKLGSIDLAQGLPESFHVQPSPDGVVTLDMIQAALPEGAIGVEQVRAGLRDMPDEDIYPQLPFSWPVTVAAEPTSAQQHLFLKRVSISEYRHLLDEKHQSRDDAINMLRNEVQVLQLIAQHPPHPNIIKYHGCRVRRGFVTAIVLDRARGLELHAYRHQGGTVDKARFLATMRSVVHHLHSVVGVAHNDINPSNIVVVDGLPVLIDFGSCRPLGWKMGTSRGTPGWEPNSYLPHSSNDRSESTSFVLPFFTSFCSSSSSSHPPLPPCEQAICWPNILSAFFT